MPQFQRTFPQSALSPIPLRARISGDWSLTQTGLVYSAAILCLGLSAAFAGKWLERVGPRLWIARVMVSWGLDADALFVVRSLYGFYELRVSHALAEAG